MLVNPQSKTKTLPLQEVLETELGTIYFYDSIVMMEAKENTLLSFKTGIFIFLKIISKVGTKPVVYISNRVNSYAVAPTDYKYLEMVPNLKGVAIVNYKKSSEEAIEIEKRFYKKPFKVFNNLNSAKEWADQILEKTIT